MGKAAQNYGRNGARETELEGKDEVSEAVRDITPLLTSFRCQRCRRLQHSTHT